MKVSKITWKLEKGYKGTMLTTSQMLCLDQANQIRCLSMSCRRYHSSRYLLDSPDFVCEFQARVLCQRQGRDIQVMQETASISALQRQTHSLLSYHAISILIYVNMISIRCPCLQQSQNCIQLLDAVPNLHMGMIHTAACRYY